MRYYYDPDRVPVYTVTYYEPAVALWHESPAAFLVVCDDHWHECPECGRSVLGWRGYAVSVSECVPCGISWSPSEDARVAA